MLSQICEICETVVISHSICDTCLIINTPINTNTGLVAAAGTLPNIEPKNADIKIKMILQLD